MRYLTPISYFLLDLFNQTRTAVQMIITSDITKSIEIRSVYCCFIEFSTFSLLLQKLTFPLSKSLPTYAHTLTQQISIPIQYGVKQDFSHFFIKKNLFMISLLHYNMFFKFPMNQNLMSAKEPDPYWLRASFLEKPNTGHLGITQ